MRGAVFGLPRLGEQELGAEVELLSTGFSRDGGAVGPREGELEQVRPRLSDGGVRDLHGLRDGVTELAIRRAVAFLALAAVAGSVMAAAGMRPDR